jgi:hypothetical protein
MDQKITFVFQALAVDNILLAGVPARRAAFRRAATVPGFRHASADAIFSVELILFLTSVGATS